MLGVPSFLLWVSIRLQLLRGTGLIPGLVQWVKGSDIAAAAAQVAAVAQLQSLARELPYAVGVAIKLKKIFEFINSDEF